jgi:hypothetical protein
MKIGQREPDGEQHRRTQGLVIQANYYASLANSSWLTHLATLTVTEHTPSQDLDDLRLVFLLGV